ncbi:hypothetical protein [Desulfuromonas versatilis]|uniref:hypothetical protein n=1 Tax=Desulfuromonas versatilis TaxID=2802975 RepID=UPI00384B0D8C
MGVENLEDLAGAARKHQVRDLKGFGEKMEEKPPQELERHARAQTRTKLAAAERLSGPLPRLQLPGDHRAQPRSHRGQGPGPQTPGAAARPDRPAHRKLPGISPPQGRSMSTASGWVVSRDAVCGFPGNQLQEMKLQDDQRP